MKLTISFILGFIFSSIVSPFNAEVKETKYGVAARYKNLTYKLEDDHIFYESFDKLKHLSNGK